MRIDQLRLLAYGPFSGEVLDFSAGEQGLHLVYGPNEAGKSTTLAAIEALLFGMSGAKLLDFVHPAADLRIGAVLRSGKEKLEIVRRRGKAGSLRGANDKDTLDLEVLGELLGNIDGNTFRQRFGINYEELVEGGQQVVAGKGEVGNLLFAAGTGLSNLKTIIGELEKSTGELFSARGSKPVLNRLLSERDAAIKKRKGDELSTAVFEAKTLAVEESQGTLRKLTAKIVELEEKIRHADAFRIAKTDIEREKYLHEELLNHRSQKTPALSEGFAEKRIALTTERAKLEASKQQLEAELKRIQEALEGLKTDPQMTANAASIDQLRSRLGSVTKALQDRPALTAAHQLQTKQRDEALKSLGLSQKQYQPLSRPDRALLDDLLARHQKLSLRQEAQKDSIAELEGQQSQLQSKAIEQAASLDVDALQLAARSGAQLRSVAAEMRTLRGQIEKETLELQTAVRQLKPWQGELADVPQLSLPAEETLRLHEDRLAKTDEALADCLEELRKLEGSCQLNQIDIDQLQTGGKVQTETDLQAAREERNALWKSIVTAGKISQEAQENFAVAQQDADAIADWLRHHSTEVAKMQSLEKERLKLSSQQANLQKQKVTLQAEAEEAHQAWQAQIKPLGMLLISPAELREWRRAAIAIQQRLPLLAEKKAKLRSQGEELLACRMRLCQALGKQESAKGIDLNTIESDFGSLVDEADQRLADLQQAKKGQDKEATLLAEKQRQLQAQKAQVDSLQQERDSWQAEWDQAMTRMSLGASRLPVEVKAILSEHERVASLQNDIDDKQERIEGIDRDQAAFAQELSALLAAIAPDLTGKEAGPALAELEKRRGEAVLVADRFANETKRKDLITQKLAEAVRQWSETEAQLNKLCEEAKCSSVEELASVEKRAADMRQLQDEHKQLRQRLSQLCGGESLEDFILQAKRQKLDEIREELRGYQTELNLAKEERDRLQQQKGILENELGQLGKSSSAAEAEQESEQLLRQIQDQAEEYARGKIAMFLLQKTIERYREKNQGPVLKRASELFSLLTLKSFAGLHPDVDESGNTVLKGARGDGKLVEVGQMSEGTCDQLYLSLRLSSLEYYLEQHRPLPLVIDDLLINFDDERCLAALQILIDLSAKTQIIFFTHHEHLLTLAQKNLKSANLFTHRMPERLARA